MTTEDGPTTPECWDPAAEIMRGSSRTFWLLSCLALVVTVGPAFARNASIPLRPPRAEMLFIPDFFQDYASARNYWNNLDPYTDHDISLKLYLSVASTDPDRPYSFKVNAHPPSSVLLFLPLAGLEFSSAFRAWNLTSLLLAFFALLLIIRHLGLPLSPWAALPMVSLALLCNALWDDLLNGQYALILLYLLVVIWAADRSGRPVLAGVFLALATAIKLFPGLLFLYFMLRRRWSALVAGLIASTVIAGATVATFGMNIYQHYFYDVYPRFSWFRNAWTNASLWGFWSRLFDGAPGVKRGYDQTAPILYAPDLALLLTLASGVAVLSFLARFVAKTPSRHPPDDEFGLAIVAMLLVSPLTWPHHLLLLIVPFSITWRQLRPDDTRRWLFLAIVFATLFLSPQLLINYLLDTAQTASPLHALTVFPIQTYMIILFMIFFYGIERPVALAAQQHSGQ